MRRRWCIAVATLAALVGGPTAFAQDQALKIGVATRGMPVTSRQARRLEKLVRDAAAARKLPLEPAKDSRAKFAQPPPISPSTEIARAKSLVIGGQDALRNFDLPAAERKFSRATKVLKRHIGLPEAIDADRARLFLGVSLAHARRDDNALNSLLAEYATRYPNEKPTDAGWPPDVMERLAARRRLPQSSIIVRSEPAATVKVDGRLYGPTPSTVAPIPAGRHRVVAEAPGYYRKDEWVQAPEAKAAEITLKLAPATARRLAQDNTEAGSTPATLEVLQVAAKDSGLTGIIVVSPKAKAQMIVGYVDLTRERIRETARFEVAATKDGAATALAQLDLHLRRRAESSEVVPLWAWIGAGAGVAAVGTGVALGFVAQGTQDELVRKTGGITQTEAFDMRSRAQNQARGGAILVSAGIAAVVGVAGWVALDNIGGGE